MPTDRPETDSRLQPAPPDVEVDLREILRRAGEGITVQGTDGQLLFANRAAAELLGFANEEALLQAPLGTILAAYELFDEEGRPLPLANLPGRRALNGEDAPEAVVRFRHREGLADRWSLVRATAVDGEGGPRYVINAFQDITELKQREIYLRVLADAADVLGRSADYEATLREVANLVVPELADWCVVDIFEAGTINRVAVAHADPDKLLMAEELQRRYPSDPGASNGPAMVAKTGEPVLVPEVTDEMLRAGARDEEHLAMMRALGVRSALVLPLIARGTVLGAMTLARAETPRPYSDGDLPLMNELARRAALAVDNVRLIHESTRALQMRDEFLATLSHDMRTPLATVLGYLQISRRHLDRMTGVERLTEFVGRAERTTIRMAHLVSELMDVSLLTAGQPIPLAVEAVDLTALIDGSLTEHRQLDGTHELSLESPEGQVIVLTDPSRVERILDNLLSNAIKYSPEGSAVRVRVATADDAVTVSVADSGVGIPAEELPRVFERFHRASTSRGALGVGLGLSGSREVARRMGGDLTVDSVLGEGSTFALRIPVMPPAGSSVEAEPTVSAG